MPGSPPTSVTEPGTIPPPRTKSNSARPVRQRVAGVSVTAERRIGGLSDGPPPPVCRSGDPPIRRFATGSSPKEFHATHAAHLPPHLGCSAPHSVQRKTERPLGTRPPRPPRPPPGPPPPARAKPGGSPLLLPPH